MPEGFVESGGELPAGGDTPIVVDAPSGTVGATPTPNTIDPTGKVSETGIKEGMADDAAKAERELAGEKPVGEGTEELTPDEQQYYDDVAEFAEANGLKLDKDYASVDELVRDLYDKSRNLETEVSTNNPIIDALTKSAEALGLPLEAIPEIIAGLDPRGSAANAPAFENLNQTLSKYSFDENGQQFYTDIGNAMMNDVMQAVKGQMGRALNSIDGKVDGISFDMQMNKFLKNDKNAMWRSREKEIRNTIKEHPTLKGKPNAIDLATRLISDSPQKQIAKTSKQIAADKIKAMQDKKKKFYTEGGGRTPQPGAIPTDPRKMNLRQIDATIDKLEAAGARVV